LRGSVCDVFKFALIDICDNGIQRSTQAVHESRAAEQCKILKPRHDKRIGDEVTILRQGKRADHDVFHHRHDIAGERAVQ